MKHLGIAFVIALGIGCNGSDDHGKGVILNAPSTMEDPGSAAAPPAMKMGSAAPTAAPDAAVAALPDPTTPAEIDRARNQAMIDGRDKDVLHYCELGKLDDKSNPQALLGCALSACRIKDDATARRYAKPLAKAYLDQARRVCAASQIAL